MKKYHFMSYSIVSIGILLLSACGSGSPTGDPMQQLASLKEQKATIDAQIHSLERELEASGLIEKKLRTVGLSEIKTSAFRHFIDLQGRVVADESVAATAKIPGVLKSVHVRNGDNVRQGQLLAQLEDAVLQKNMAELEGQLAVAEDLYNRQKSLWDQNIGSEVQLIQARNNKESLERSIATLKENIAMTKIYAPTSGTVDHVMLKQGEAIAPGVPLCTIINLSKLKIEGAVTEAYASRVKKGDQVQVFFPDMKTEITTKISYVSRSINPTNRTFNVECALGKGDYTANQIAVMKIVDYHNPNAISIPVNLIQSGEDGDYVMIVEKTDAEHHALVKKVKVEQGQNYNGYVEIRSGLKDGDQVISTGFQDVNAGETVLYL